MKRLCLSGFDGRAVQLKVRMRLLEGAAPLMSRKSAS
jgi:hypothetical protein